MICLKILIVCSIPPALFFLFRYLQKKDNDFRPITIQPVSGPHESFYDFLDTYLAIGSFEAGRPQDVWKTFDAVINCSTVEHPGILESKPKRCFYTHIPFLDGNYEDFLALLPQILPIIHEHQLKKRTLLVHCVEGKSRSVAVVLAYLVSLLELKKSEQILMVLSHQIQRYRKQAEPHTKLLQAIFKHFEMRVVLPENL